MTVGVPHVKSGRLRALAVTSDKRSAALPDAPTMTEAGYPAVNATSWFGLVAPAKTPKLIVTRLHSEMKKILAQREVRERFEAQHAVVVGSAPAEFGKFVAREIAQWKEVAKAGNIKAE